MKKKEEIILTPEEQKLKEEEEKKRFRIVVILTIAIIFIIGFPIMLNSIDPRANNHTDETTVIENSGSSFLIENPIDFDTLKQGNDEIYSWIKIDDTNIDYPIVQSKTDDAFYLRHKAEDKSWSASGAIYTECANSKGWNDPVTVVYGHNGFGDEMFTTLHKFEDKEFFDSHPYFTIYTPTKIITYQVVSAFKYDDRHIMNSFNFDNTVGVYDFFQTVKNPDSTNKNVRTELDVKLTTENPVVVLSTCITNQKSSRYLVCGVLVKYEKTN